MKYFTLALSALILASIGSNVSFADDDFGAPFTDQAPAALADKPMTIEDVPPHLIEPAAGDEVPVENVVSEEPAAQESTEEAAQPVE